MLAQDNMKGNKEASRFLDQISIMFLSFLLYRCSRLLVLGGWIEYEFKASPRLIGCFIFISVVNTETVFETHTI